MLLILKIVRIIIALFILQGIFSLVLFSPVLNSPENKGTLGKALIWLVVGVLLFAFVQIAIRRSGNSTQYADKKVYKTLGIGAVIAATLGFLGLLVLIIVALSAWS